VERYSRVGDALYSSITCVLALTVCAYAIGRLLGGLAA